MTPRLKTDYPDPAGSPGLALWRVTHSWQRRIRAALAPHGLTHVQFVLLASLAWMDHGTPVTQRRLAELAGTDAMMTSQVLRALEALGLVLRTPHPTDRRAMLVQPTAAGIEVANRANGAVEAADREFFGVLDEAELSALLRGMRRLEAGPGEPG